MNKKRTVLLLVPVAAATAAIAVATTPHAQEAPAGPPAHARDAGAVYSVFRTGSPPAADQARRRAETPAFRRMTPDPARTRLLRTAGEVKLFGLADDRNVCLYVERSGAAGRQWGSTACATLDDADASKHPVTSTTFLGDGRYQLSALVPDGITELSVEVAGDAVVLPVKGNAVTREFDAAPRNITWRSGDGTGGSAQGWTDG